MSTKVSRDSADGGTIVPKFGLTESIMKIDDRVSNYMSLLNNQEIPPVAKQGDVYGALKAAQKGPIEVDLSSAAVQLADDEARRERLNVIRQQLSEGSYNISGKDVANKILNVLKG